MKHQIESDYSYYLKLVGFPRSDLGQIEIYKACIIDATNGRRHHAEEQLSPLQKNLLEARRLMNTQQLDPAQRLICKINKELEKSAPPSNTESFLLQGDIQFISGLFLTFKGDFKSASQKMNQAAIFYERSNDLRRVFKSLINEQICNYNSLVSYETGPISVFKRSSLQNNFHDLLGNIFRSQSFELLVEGKIPQAIHYAQEAQAQYFIDGYPDDQMTATIIESIGHALLNDFEQPKNTLLKMNTEQRNKSQAYLSVLKDLIFGKIPCPPPTHPLSRIPWKQLIIKTGSLKAKLVDILKKGPETRDSLIAKLWGESSIHPSYGQRLHSLIGEIRDGHLHFIHFDGEYYRLI